MYGISGFLKFLEFSEKLAPVQMRLQVSVVQTTVQIVQPEQIESRISLNSCWVGVLARTVNTSGKTKVVLIKGEAPLTHT